MKCERTTLSILLLINGWPLAGDEREPALRLKVSDGFAARSVAPTTVRRREPGRRHQVIQFTQAPSADMLAALRARGFRVLAYIPENAVLVSGPEALDLRGLPVRWAGLAAPVDKVSGLVGVDDLEAAIVEFYEDVDDGTARGIVIGSGLEIVENPDLARHHLIVRSPAAGLRKLAEWDEVARVFPASEELVRGERVVPCEHGGPGLLGLQIAANLVSAYGDGWDGPGLGAASLSYYFGRMPAGLPTADVQRGLLAAMGQWSGVVQLHFSQSFTAKLRRQIEFEWMAGSHGDGYGFDGPGGILAHSFYPPPNAEPAAGNLHFDAAESWKIGADVDIYSVALHELGHVLGLGHNDNPNSVMYPYYRRMNGLRPADVTEIQKLYAAVATASGSVTPPVQPPVPVAPTVPVLPATPVPGPAPAPATPTVDKTAPSVTITSPSSALSATSGSSLLVRGIASDNIGVVKVSWSSSAGSGGDAAGTSTFTAGPIPLYQGRNTITVRAWDAAGNQGWRTINVTRK